MSYIRSMLVAAALLSCAVSFAQTPTPSLPPPPPANPGGETGSGPRFDQAKQKHLERLQQEVSCVQVATSFEAMRACRPQHGAKN